MGISDIGIIISLIGIAGIIIFWKMKKESYRNIAIVIAVFGFLLFGFTNKEEAKQTTTVSSTQQTTTSSTKEIVKLDTQQQEVLDDINDFPKFLDLYSKLNQDNESPVRDQLFGKRVTWSGTIVEVGSDKVYVIESSKYEPGMTWQSANDSKLQYYVFIAKFKDKINPDAFPVGTESTFSGDLDSPGSFRGNANWKIYNAVRGQ